MVVGPREECTHEEAPEKVPKSLRIKLTTSLIHVGMGSHDFACGGSWPKYDRPVHK